jgi:hypothetical protein
VKTTQRAGKFKPIAKVDVANTTLRYPSENKISTSSFKIYKSPA